MSAERVGIAVAFAGLAIIVSVIIPKIVWFGLLWVVVGSGIFFVNAKNNIRQNGIKGYVPSWLDEVLRRHDTVERLIVLLQSESFINKFVRLLSTSPPPCIR
jgi:hypothetical protein